MENQEPKNIIMKIKSVGMLEQKNQTQMERELKNGKIDRENDLQEEERKLRKYR